MEIKNFEKFSKEHIVFHEPEVIPLMLREVLKKLDDKKMRILDLGCGECNVLTQLIRKGINADYYGIDISKEKIERAKRITKGKIKLSVQNCGNTSFKNDYFDLIICTQVIEHVDDKGLVKELSRILKRGGFAYITSVRRKKIAIYLYRKNGRFVSDPSHQREYANREEFSKLFKNFAILMYKEKRFKHSLLDLYLRFFIKVKIINPDRVLRIYEKNRFLFLVRNAIRIPLIGFYCNEILIRKN